MKFYDSSFIRIILILCQTQMGNAGRIHDHVGRILHRDSQKEKIAGLLADLSAEENAEAAAQRKRARGICFI